VEVVATGIEDVFVVVASGHGGAIIEGVAETGTAWVVHEAVAAEIAAVEQVAAWIEDKVAVDVAAARVIYEGVAGVCVADSVVLRINAIVIEWAASGIENDVETDTVSYKIRKRTVAAVGVIACSSVVVMAV
jgi:hypothetical protein